MFKLCLTVATKLDPTAACGSSPLRLLVLRAMQYCLSSRRLLLKLPMQPILVSWVEPKSTRCNVPQILKILPTVSLLTVDTLPFDCSYYRSFLVLQRVCAH